MQKNNKMKKLSTLVIFSMLLAFAAPAKTISPAAPGVIDAIAAAIRGANAGELAKYFSNTVEIMIPGKEGTFSKSQAVMIIKDFFEKNAASSFSTNQQGSSNGGAQFMIGTYKSGKVIYHVYVLIKPVAGQMLIQQLHFESE
jgi:hypothetical protein